MEYQNPLDVIHDKNWEELSAENLKKWRKEILLEFELSNSTTILKNGRSFDKDTVLKTFEILEKEGHHHVKIASNPGLKKFLKTGSTEIFKQENWTQIFEDPEFGEWIKPIFQSQLSQLVYKIASRPSTYGIRKLKNIKRAEESIPPELFEPAFVKTYSYLNGMLKEGIQKYRNPLLPTRKIQFKEGIDRYLNISMLNVLVNMPSSFLDLQFRYALFAHSIVHAVFHQPRRVQDLPKDAIKTLRAASKISLAFRKDEDLEAILKDLEAYMDNSIQTAFGNLSWRTWLYIILAITFFSLRVMNCN